MADHAPMIFVSYRGSDEPWASELVYTGMAAAFGTKAVFKAGHSLQAGETYPPILEQMASSCPIMLVCIGPSWLAAQAADGARRLEEHDDWVRREIELALRAGNHVIPLLLGNRDEVVIPAPEQLPAAIAPLAYRQAFRLEPGGRLRITLPDLAARLRDLVPSLPAQLPAAAGLAVRQKIGRVEGRAILLRGSESVTLRGDFVQDIDTLASTGEAITLDLVPPDPGMGEQ